MNPPDRQRPPNQRRKFLTVCVAGIILLASGLYFKYLTPDPSPPLQQTSGDPIPSPTPPPAPDPPRENANQPVTDHPVLAATANLLADDGDANADIEILTVVLADYRKALGENPVGENEEITASLLGSNAKHLRFIPQGHRAIDSQGRLCDRWGTPLFFHTVSARQLVIRSAGPDREHGTPDDLTGM